MTPGFWRGRKVLVTGHTGFKGAWLALLLHEAGAQVSGYALAPATEPSLHRDARTAEILADEAIADVRDLPLLQAFLAKTQPEIVFHLAAQSLVRRSYVEPAETYATNLIGTANLLESVRACPAVRAAIVVTTDKCYENTGRLGGYREDDALGGRDPYACSKAAAELVTTAYRLSFFADGTAVATARAGNVIGGGDWASERLMTDVVDAFSNGRAVRLRYPEAVRPWQHVLDALHGYLVLGEALIAHGQEFAQAWNFGPADEDSRPVSWMVESAARLWGGAARWQRDPGLHPHEAAVLRLDAGKARRLLAWKPALGVEEALTWTVEWYRAHANEPAIARALCHEQIGQFMGLAAG